MADNKSIQKVFGLSDFRKKQLLGEIPERTREAFREYGYVFTASVDRIDYSNDSNTSSFRSVALFSTTSGATVGNSNFGYNGGKFWGGDSSTIQRLDYSNDTSGTSIRGSLTSARGRFGAAGNQNFGYFVCGASISNPGKFGTSVDRIEYSNDLNTASIRGSSLISRLNNSSVANSNFLYTSHGISSIERITFSNDLVRLQSRGNTYNSIITNGSAVGNQNFGYWGGGQPGAVVSIIQRISYSNDTANGITRTNLSFSRIRLSSTGNSNFGYFIAGADALTIFKSSIDRLDYSNDTAVVSIRGPLRLSVEWYGSGATSSHSFGGTPNSSFASNFTFPTVPNAGYFGGGSDATNEFASIDKVDYANDTATASVRSALSSARYSLAATGNGSYGYYAGGRPTPTSPDVSTIGRIEYSSDTQNAVVRSTLNNAVRLLAAAGNSNFGYFGGGFPTRNGVDRLDYSSDTTATSPRQGLPLATYSLAATGNNTFGYFVGGLTASPTTHRSEIYRVDYSNDLTIPQNRGPLSEAKREGVATGDDNFGYFGGAQNPGLSPSYRTQIERLDYSNDTLITSVRSILTSQRFNIGASGNSNFGYFGSGTNGPSYFSTIDRINYSNDTAIAQVRGPLPVAKSKLAATSPLAYGGAPIYFTNPLPQVFQDQIEFDDSNTLDLPFKRVLGSFGYFGGGNGLSSRVDRIDYSNDTTSASVRGSLNVSTEFHSALGNSNFGYYIGGANFFYSYIQRVDYSNDLSTTSNRGNDVSRRLHCSVGNQNFGYTIGGDGGAATQIRKFNYSNDTANTSLIGSFTPTRRASAATGNSNFGYIAGGGIQPTVYSTVERLNFSNDNTKTLVRGPLSSTRYSHSATGNNNFGWFGGEFGPNVSIVDRIDYSNDTSITSVRGTILGRRDSAATGNSNFGYFGGGFRNGPNVADISRIDYSNDLATATIRGPLSLGRGRLAATTNARNS